MAANPIEQAARQTVIRVAEPFVVFWDDRKTVQMFEAQRLN